MSSPLWPAVNACLNFTAFSCLAAGYIAIKGGRRDVHKRWMLAAFSCSTVFLASYVAYHFQVGSVRFTGEGPIRYVYLTILATHVVLAAVVAPLALTTLRRGLGGRLEAHRSIARVTFPIWVYVSLTGVVVYLMLYRM